MCHTEAFSLVFSAQETPQYRLTINKYLGAIYWQINCLWTKTLEKEAMSKFMQFLEKFLCIISKMSENIVPKDFPTS